MRFLFCCGCVVIHLLLRVPDVHSVRNYCITAWEPYVDAAGRFLPLWGITNDAGRCLCLHFVVFNKCI